MKPSNIRDSGGGRVNHADPPQPFPPDPVVAQKLAHIAARSASYIRKALKIEPWMGNCVSDHRVVNLKAARPVLGKGLIGTCPSCGQTIYRDLK